MVHRGRIIHDFRGSEKRRLKPEELLNRFEVVQNEERLDGSAAELLARTYV
jgi:putative ABC transport system ATP-binding protein